MDDKKIVDTFDEELDVITDDIEEEDGFEDDDTEEIDEIEEIDTEDLSGVEATGGADGDWVTFGRFSYMVVVPREHPKCDQFKKGANRFPSIVKDNTCSACTRLFSHKGYWLCARSKSQF